MTINSLQLNSSTPFAGLGTATFNVLTAGLYTVDCQSTIPYNASGNSLRTDQTSPFASALQIVINLNGGPVLTVGGASTNPTPTQPSLGGRTVILCAASDVITVVLSSANAVDATPNAVKSIINVFQGE